MLERAHPPRRALLAILPLLLAVGLLLASPASADAATIVVNSSGEDLIDNGQCTLVEAILNANDNLLSHPDCLVAGQGGGIVDRIELRISPGFDPNFGCDATTRVCTILLSATYGISDAVAIDGYTQAQSRPNSLAVGSDALIKIRLLPRPGVSVGTGLRIDVTNVTIRGLAVGGFAREGIHIAGGSNARIVGCFIGIDPNGTQAIMNGDVGIFVSAAASSAIIGGTSPADHNLISGNDIGIAAQNADPTNVTIQGNAIGTDAAGTGGVPNVTGVVLASSGNLVGGTAPGEGNVIAFNTVAGVRVIASGGAASGNRVLGNAISSNRGLGIDLVGGTETEAGVTINDDRDFDLGPNNLQNYPSLTSVGVRVNTTVHGGLNSTPNRQFRIELFSNTTCDGSGFGEGQTFLGAVNATTDGSGNASFIATFPQTIQVGLFITGTATDPDGSTSEFSGCSRVQQADIGWASSTKPTTEAHESNLPDTVFSMALTSLPTADVTVPLTISDPTEGAIVGPTSLTFTPASGTNNQTVSLIGADDGIDDGDVPYTVIIGVASSADPNYNGINPPDVNVVNVDNDDRALQCGPRPRVVASVAKIGGGQLRATVAVTTNPGTQNELVSIAWTRFDTATVVLDGVGPVQVGQVTPYNTPLTQSASFVITRTPGAQAGTVRLIVADGCGDWPTFVGGGPNAW
jgi:hypothetical protein